MKPPFYAAVLVGLVFLCGCSSSEAPLVAGGPTPTQAIDAMLANPRILQRDRVAVVEKRVRLEATDCSKHPNGVVTCWVRLYSIGRGWSAASMGRFTLDGGNWSFDF